MDCQALANFRADFGHVVHPAFDEAFCRVMEQSTDHWPELLLAVYGPGGVDNASFRDKFTEAVASPLARRLFVDVDMYHRFLHMLRDPSAAAEHAAFLKPHDENETPHLKRLIEGLSAPMSEAITLPTPMLVFGSILYKPVLSSDTPIAWTYLFRAPIPKDDAEYRYMVLSSHEIQRFTRFHDYKYLKAGIAISRTGYRVMNVEKTKVTSFDFEMPKDPADVVYIDDPPPPPTTTRLSKPVVDDDAEPVLCIDDKDLRPVAKVQDNGIIRTYRWRFKAAQAAYKFSVKNGKKHNYMNWIRRFHDTQCVFNDFVQSATVIECKIEPPTDHVVIDLDVIIDDQ